MAALALASSPTLRLTRDEEMVALRPWAAELAEALGGVRIVVNNAAPGYRQLLNTALAEDAPLPSPSRAGEGAWDLIQRVVETGRPAVSDLFTGRTAGAFVVAVAAPVLNAGRIERVVVVGIDPARLSALLLAQDLSGEGFASVADGRGRIVARSRDHKQFLGTVPPSRNRGGDAAQKDVFRSPTIYGYEGLFARQPLRNAAGWTVVVAEPLATHRAAWLHPMLGLALGAVLVLTLATAAAAIVARLVLSPIRALRHQAEEVAFGDRRKVLSTALATTPARVAEFEALRLSIVRANTALHAGEAEFRAAFEQSAVPMQQTDCGTGRFLRVNEAFCRLLGRPAEALVGQSFLDVTHPEDRQRDLEGFHQMVHGEIPLYEFEKRFIQPDGSVRRVRIASSPIRDERGRPLRTIAVLQDITARAATEEANARLAAIVSSTTDAIISFAAEDGRILSWNRGAEELFGYKQVEALGAPAGLLVPPELPEGDPTGVFRWVMDGRRLHQYETVRVAKGGERISVSVTATQMTSPDGRVLGVSGIFRDLRAHKAADARQKLLMREVDHRAKNALAVVQAALKLTPKEDPEAYARAVGGRVTALARAHTLLAEERWAGADLQTLAMSELAPFMSISATGHNSDAQGQQPRAELVGPPLPLVAEAVQAVAMILHELATNATKHGALSASGGRVLLSWRVDRVAGVLRMRWSECGGPPVSVPTRRGFGSRVLEAIARDQLGGRVSRDWQISGLTCDIELPSARVMVSNAA